MNRFGFGLIGLALVLSAGVASGESCRHAGEMLVAEPEMEDPDFRVSVVMLLSRDVTRARGVIVNRIGAVGPLKELGEGCGLPSTAAREQPVAVHFGGPLLPQAARVIHSDDFRGESSCAMGDGLVVSEGCEVLRALAEGRGPERYLVVRGMAAWEAGQLQREVAGGLWRRVPFDSALVLGLPDVAKWHRARELASSAGRGR